MFCLMEFFALDVVCPLLLWYYICFSLLETSSSSHTAKKFTTLYLILSSHYQTSQAQERMTKKHHWVLKPMSQIYFLFHLTNCSNLLIVSPTAFRFYEHQITASFFFLWNSMKKKPKPKKIEQTELNKNAAFTLTLSNINFLIGMSDVLPSP